MDRNEASYWNKCKKINVFMTPTEQHNIALVYLDRMPL